MEAVEEKAPVQILYGTVTAESPLEITIEQRLRLAENHLVLTRNVTDFQTEISFDDPEIKNEIQIGNRPFAPDGTLITNPDLGTEESVPAIIQGKFSFKEKVKHKITCYNALKTGEIVLLIRMQGGQRFIVIDRVGVGYGA